MNSKSLLLFLIAYSIAHADPVYLTFDDGPNPSTKFVLEALAEASAKATFFVVADNVKTFPDTDQKKIESQKTQLQAILKAGHGVGNHTKTHLPMTVSDYSKTYWDPLTAQQKSDFKEKFTANEEWFKNVIGDPKFAIKWARLPGAGGNLSSLEYLRKETNSLNLQHKSWSFEFAPNGVFAWVPHSDWQGIAGVAASHTGLPPTDAIILFHDHHWDEPRKATLVALLKFLKSKNYEFVLFK